LFFITRPNPNPNPNPYPKWRGGSRGGGERDLEHYCWGNIEGWRV